MCFSTKNVIYTRFSGSTEPGIVDEKCRESVTGNVLVLTVKVYPI
ncbi:hypothetical protein JSMCR1_p259 (plasmid) [Escherichia coli]|uniref:Uncharacterized protein n=1 Tax=Escherichia coli TaxID=562 RepID=A0A649Z429_ECOLX|nr:hypothetical protein [Escherichia coli]UUF21937.1 hypothetical protein JSMCR1_p259 [Escherichia coli]